MSLRFETYYKIKRNDNLGDPKWHDFRWEDIDKRMHARELDGQRINAALEDVQALALARLNDTLVPIIQEALTRLSEVGAVFTATSVTENTVGLGTQSFVIAERETFVVTDFVAIRPASDTTGAIGEIAAVESYDRETALLTVNAVQKTGTGTYSDWVIRVAAAPDLEHASRLDNPHATTAAQVGAYTTAQADTAISTAINTAITNLINSAPSALDTLKELSDALGGDANFSATVTTALGNRIRKDVAQVLTLTERHRFRANVMGSPLRALADGNFFPNPGFDHSQQYGTTGVGLTSGVPLYGADEMQCIYTAGAGVLLTDRVPASTFPVALPGHEFGLRLLATTALSSMTNGTGRAWHYFAEEWNLIAKLQWGTASARRLGYVFQYYSTNAGTIMLRFHNQDASRVYYVEHAVVAGWNLISGCVIGDTGGTWSAAPVGGYGMIMNIACAGAEAVKQSSFSAWGGTLKMQSTNLGNLLSTNNSMTIVTGLMLAPDIDFSMFDQTELKAALPDMVMDAATAERRCQRYFYRTQNEIDGWGFGVSGNNIIGHAPIPVATRFGAAAGINQYGNCANSLIQYNGVNASTTSWTISLNGPSSIGINAAGGTITSATGVAANIRIGWSGAHGVEINSRML